MRFKPRKLILAFTALPIISSGCTTSGRNMTGFAPASAVMANTEPVQTSQSIEATLRTDRVASSIKTVAYQENNTDNASSEPLDDVVHLPVPVEGNIAPITAAGLTLEAIEQLAMANNPAILQATAASARAGGIRTQVGLKPNPTVGYNATQLFDAGTDQHTFFVEQTFVRGDKLAWNRAVIDHDVNTMNWEIETQRQRVRTDIRMAFYDALVAQKRLKLASDFQTVAAEGVSVSEERVKAKVGTRPDILQSSIQLKEINLSIMQAEFEFAAAMNELAALAGVPDLGASILIGELDSSYDSRDSESVFTRIVSMSPQLAAAQARVDRARANLKRQQVQPVSNVTAQIGAGTDRGTGQGLMNLQLSMPIPVHNKNQGNIQAAHAEYCAATQNIQRIRQSIRRELAVVMKEYQIAEATVQQYDESILPMADETLKLMREAQAAGEFDFLRVLTARRAYFDANLRYVTALGNLAQANAKLDGLLLTGGLSQAVSYEGGDDLRGQALDGQ